MSLGGQIRSEIIAQRFPIHEVLDEIKGSNALNLACSATGALMADPETRFSRTPLSVPQEYAGVASAELLVGLLNSGFNRSHQNGLAVHPNNPAIEFCNSAEYRFLATHNAMQDHIKSGTWESGRGVRLVVDGANNPLFVQKAPYDKEEIALALTVGDVTIAGHTFPPGFLARIKVTENHPKIAQLGRAEKISVRDIVSARILRMSAFVLSAEEREHWPYGDLLEEQPQLDADVTVKVLVETAKQTADMLPYTS